MRWWVVVDLDVVLIVVRVVRGPNAGFVGVVPPLVFLVTRIIAFLTVLLLVGDGAEGMFQKLLALGLRGESAAGG